MMSTDPFSEIFAAHDAAVNARERVNNMREFISDVNCKIRDEIRSLRPFYPGSTKVNIAEIYIDHYEYNPDLMTLKEWYEELIERWEDSPSHYQISAADKARISAMAKDLCSWDKFSEAYDADQVAQAKFDQEQNRLLGMYCAAPKTTKYVNDLLRRYLDELRDSADIEWGPRQFIHVIERLYIEQCCDIILVPRPEHFPVDPDQQQEQKTDQ